MTGNSKIDRVSDKNIFTGGGAVKIVNNGDATTNEEILIRTSAKAKISDWLNPKFGKLHSLTKRDMLSKSPTV